MLTYGFDSANIHRNTTIFGEIKMLVSGYIPSSDRDCETQSTHTSLKVKKKEKTHVFVHCDI